MSQALDLENFKRAQFEDLRSKYPGTIQDLEGNEYFVAYQLPDVSLQTREEGPVDMRGAVFYIDKKDYPAEPAINTVFVHEGLEYSVNRQTSRSKHEVFWRVICIQRHG